MPGSDRVYRTLQLEGTNDEAAQLRARWNDVSTNRLREAIASSTTLPRTFEPLEIGFGSSKVQVEDLRGADLSGLKVGDYDLAYCALDYSKFEHSRLVGTRLQYSRLVGASFLSATLEEVQGSPVDAEGANFSHARLITSFFSHSNFDHVKSESTEIRSCDFTECSSPLDAPGQPRSKFVYSASKNEAVVRRVVDYLEAGENKSVGKKTADLSLKVGATKIGRVAAGPSHADYVVIVQYKPRQTVNGKTIRKQVEYKILAAATPFSVGDAVRITSLAVDGRFVSKSVLRNYVISNRPPTPTPKFLKSPSWWILDRASSDESGGLEAADA